jgi:hypothetical protein
VIARFRRILCRRLDASIGEKPNNDNMGKCSVVGIQEILHVTGTFFLDRQNGLSCHRLLSGRQPKHMRLDEYALAQRIVSLTADTIAFAIARIWVSLGAAASPLNAKNFRKSAVECSFKQVIIRRQASLASGEGLKRVRFFSMAQATLRSGYANYGGDRATISSCAKKMMIRPTMTALAAGRSSYPLSASDGEREMAAPRKSSRPQTLNSVEMTFPNLAQKAKCKRGG